MNPNHRRGLVHDLILGHAATRPHATAIIHGENRIVYHSLARRVTALADRLALEGVRADQVVGLHTPRSLDGIVAMLGILAAGGAFLYLDPDLPPARLAYLVADADVPLLVRAGTHRRLPFAIPTLHADRAGPHRRPPPRQQPIAPQPSHLAYVAYTSGSTGTPRGVAVEHHSVTNMVHQLGHVFDLRPGRRMLQFAAWSWDASMCEILVPLAAGGTVVICPDPARHHPTLLARVLRRTHIDTVTLTPAVLRLTPTTDLPRLRTVAAVGEPCPPEVVTRWAAPGRRILNGYGPTEATVAVSVGECQPDQPVHIGAPLPGVRARVVDHQRRPVSAGQPGQLLVGGTGLARGYLGDDPTGGRFHTDPDGTRWFDTGDRALQRPDGTLIHLGRHDQQIHLRGHRIELGEIEATLRRHPHVAACAATVHHGQLVAHVVPRTPTPDLTELRTAVRDWLPQHMIPDIRIVERLPDPNHQIPGHGTIPDRPAPSATSPIRDPVLADVLSVVRHVLHTDQIGPHDDLYAAGGHSLLTAELALGIATRFHHDLPDVALIDHPTPAGIAALLRDGPFQPGRPAR